MRATHLASQRAGLPALTGARFFAAFSVVVYHYGSEALAPVWPVVGSMAAVGPAAVSFFYVLSGAVLTWGCTDPRGEPARPPRLFWGQRAARILPAYLFALGLAAVPFAKHVFNLHPLAPGLVRIAVCAAAALALVQAFVPQLALGLNAPGWSISCEAFFYAVWPRLVGRARPSRPGLPWRAGLLLWAAALVAPTLGLVAISASLLPAGTFPTVFESVTAAELLVRTLSYFPLLRLPEFLLGVFIGQALRQTPARARTVAADTLREVGLFALLLAAGWALGTGLPGRITGVPLANRICIEGGLLAPLFALWVWQLARGQGLLQRLAAAPALLALGEASYALYILQEPVFVWVSLTLKRVAPLLFVHWSSTFWAYAALLVIASLAVHRLIELPMRAQLMARLAARRAAS